jgi:ubiquinol-cytochrome c reductase cytochrome c1 subunit
MRYNRLKDLGLSEEQIKANLLFTGDKVGEMMTTTMNPKDAKAWFGVVPPDLSVIQRAKASGAGSGSDYLYTYLRSFYKDDTRPTGWNNLVVNNVAMPHVCGNCKVYKSQDEEVADPHEAGKMTHQFAGFEQVTPGKQQVGVRHCRGRPGRLHGMDGGAGCTDPQLGVWSCCL